MLFLWLDIIGAWKEGKMPNENHLPFLLRSPEAQRGQEIQDALDLRMEALADAAEEEAREAASREEAMGPEEA